MGLKTWLFLCISPAISTAAEDIWPNMEFDIDRKGKSYRNPSSAEYFPSPTEKAMLNQTTSIFTLLYSNARKAPMR